MKPTKIEKIVLIALLAVMGLGLSFGTDAMAQGFKRHFHIHQTSLTGFVVTCDNGADPTVQGTGNTAKNELSVSCGVEK